MSKLKTIIKKTKSVGKPSGIFKGDTDGKPEPTLDFEHTDWGYYDKDNLPRPMDNQLRRLLELNL